MTVIYLIGSEIYTGEGKATLHILLISFIKLEITHDLGTSIFEKTDSKTYFLTVLL